MLRIGCVSIRVSHIYLLLLLPIMYVSSSHSFAQTDNKNSVISAISIILIHPQAAAGWPTSELLDRPIAAYFNIPSVLDDHDRVPSLLNGGLEKVRPEFWGFCLGLTAAIDSYQTQRSRSQIDYTPGDLGWDPLNFAKEGTESRAKLQLAEIQNGRLAMFGVTGFAVQEAVGHSAVVDETPVFFHPITETVEIILKGLVQ